MAGILKVVATPIGNLGDISQRAKDALSKSKVILAEDTRKTMQFLQALGITLMPDARIVSCYSQVEAERAKVAIERLSQGDDVVLVSDAGSPGISDPGTLLVDAVVSAGFSVEVIPGACALVAALMGAGLRAPRFAFLGFLPKRKSLRERLIKQSFSVGLSLIIYESALRVSPLLKELQSYLGQQRVVVARELTKIYETFHRGHLGSQLSPEVVEKGECVIVVEYASGADEKAEEVDEEALKARILQCLKEKKQRPKEIAKLLAAELNLSPKEVYDLVVALKHQ